jgi:hypothetical protein
LVVFLVAFLAFFTGAGASGSDSSTTTSGVASTMPLILRGGLDPLRSDLAKARNARGDRSGLILIVCYAFKGESLPAGGMSHQRGSDVSQEETHTQSGLVALRSKSVDSVEQDRSQVTGSSSCLKRDRNHFDVGGAFINRVSCVRL